MWRGREVVVAVVCLALGSVGQLAQFLVTPVDSGGSVAENAAAAAAAPGRMQAAAWLDLTILFFVPALLVAGRLAAAGTTRLGWVATLIAVGTTLFGIAYVLAPDAMYAGKAPSSAIQAYMDAPVVGVSTVVFLVGHVLGMVLLGIALWRTGQVPRWAGVCLAIYPFAEFGGTGAGVPAVVVAGYLLLTLAFGACAVTLVGHRRDRTAQVNAPDVAAVASSGY
jgi:hypothetical protein